MRLDEVALRGRHEAGEERAGALGRGDLAEAADEALVVRRRVELDASLNDVDGRHRAVGEAAADAAGEGACGEGGGRLGGGDARSHPRQPGGRSRRCGRKRAAAPCRKYVRPKGPWPMISPSAGEAATIGCLAGTAASARRVAADSFA